jgi:mannose/fructose/N-acetylgalactosamine-specific phosphotransferase system component IID/mannose/fructose/N-acetylgalactosamine-specific phosphotransferase system component IIC
MSGTLGVTVALLLGLWVFFAQAMLYATTMWFMDPIISGLVAGLVVHNVPLGLAIGGSLELMSLGLWPYGGTLTPDFLTGAVVGTAFASLSHGTLAEATTAGIAIAVPVSVIFTQGILLAKTINLFLLHRADRYIEAHNEKGIGVMQLCGILTFGLCRGIPLFLLILLGAAPVQKMFNAIPAWLTRGLTLVAGFMPALGFGILLTMLPLRKWWSFFVLGFALYAYLHVPLIGIAIIAVAMVVIFVSRNPAETTAAVEDQMPATPVFEGKSPVTHGDLVKALWRHNTTFELTFNYERMQALGYTYSILPVLKKIYPKEDEFFAALKRHMVFFNTNVIIGSPTIFGAVCALEEAKQPEMADQLKLSLMGPAAGIGDTITGVLVQPIFGAFAAGLALAGHSSAAAVIMVMNLLFFIVKFPGFWLGYSRGLNLVKQLSSGIISRVTEAASMVALMVMGGFIPNIMSWRPVATTIAFTHSLVVDGKTVTTAIKLQDTLDAILPYMLPLLLVFFVYWLIKHKHWRNLQVLGLLVILAIILGAFKLF